MRKIFSRYNVKFLLLILVSLVFILSGVSVHASWVEKAQAPESGGYGQAVVNTADHIYLVREMYASSQPGFWRYNPDDDSWEEVPTLGLSAGAFRNGTALAWDGGSYIYALGGARYKDSDRRSFYRFDLEDNKWIDLPGTPGPQGAGNALTYSGYDNSLYAWLGSKEHGGTFARYKPNKGNWEKLSKPGFGVVTDDGASLVWGGGAYLFLLQGEIDESLPNNRFLRYNIKEGIWTDMSSIPEGSCGVGDGGSILWAGRYNDQLSDYIYALGGGCAEEDKGKGFYRYDVSENSWSPLVELPHPVGYYNGNRLGFIGSSLYYWQGSPGSWSGGGDEFYSVLMEEPEVKEPPTADMEAEPISGNAPLEVTFSAIRSEDHDGYITRYRWNFGDGSRASGKKTSHIYSTRGTYQVELRVADNDGLTDTDIEKIEVKEDKNGCRACLEELNEASYSEFKEVYGIGDTLASRLVEHQPFDPPQCEGASDLKEELQKIPYISPKRSASVIEYFCPELD